MTTKEENMTDHHSGDNARRAIKKTVNTATNTEPCVTCGRPMPITRATLASGLSHTACKYTLRSLTASAADLDSHALRVWAVRQRLSRAVRAHGRRTA